MRITTSLVLALFVTPGGAGASEQVPAPPQSGPVALVGGTLHPLSGPTVEDGTILFENGRITALGRGIEIPADAMRIEIPGRHVYPALIESASNLGLVEIGSISATNDFREIGEINPNVRAETAINPDSERLPVTRSNGVGLAVSLPSGGLIPGLGALVELDGWTWEEMTVKAPVCLVVEWPDMSGMTGLTEKKALEQRKKNVRERIEALETAFREARAYLTAKKAAKGGNTPPPATDVRWEAMVPVLERETPVWVRANSLQQITAAVEWSDRVGVRMTLVGGEDAPLAADMLKKRDIPVVVTPVLRLPSRRDEAYDQPLTLPESLRRAGIRFCISGGYSGFGNERNLPYHAAMAAAHGLPKEEALRSVSLYPAEIIGVGERLGSLEPGKDASLIVTDGDPLEITTRVERMFLRGRDIDLGNRQRSLHAKYRERYRQKDGE